MNIKKEKILKHKTLPRHNQGSPTQRVVLVNGFVIKLLEFSSLFNEKIRNPLNLALWEGFERNSSAFKVFLDLFCYRFMIFYAPVLNNNSNTKC